MLRRLSVLALALALASPLAAQQQDDIPRYHSIVSINPLGIPFEIASIEVESVMLQGITIGGALNYVAPGDDPRFLTGDVKLRYYPDEVAMQGLSLGLAGGFVRYSNRVCVPDDTGCVQTREKLTAPSISVLADYNFMLGAQRRFVVGTGVGAKRIIASRESRERVDIPRAYPFVRFVVGLAF